MNYLSVCSGIEAATVAWHPLGWNPVGFSEIESFPSQVLKHHYPEVTNYGDMTKFKEWQIESNVDVFVGGTPCQSFSVAGLRKGLDDPRGNLMLTYLAIAKQYRPSWLVWENVPGVLSSSDGRDFGSFLGGLAICGYGFAYRVLDAQYFGVAQRRKRVFVVGYLGNWRPAAAVLFERESLSGHPKPSREARKVTPTLSSSGTGVSRVGFNCEDQWFIETPIAARMTAFGEYQIDGTASAMKARDWKDATDLIAQPVSAYSIREDAKANTFSATELEVANALKALQPSPQSHHAQTFVTQPIAFQLNGDRNNPSVSVSENQAFCIPANPMSDRGQAVATQVTVAPTLTASNDPSRSPQSTEITNQVAAIHATNMAVRRLTPVECERLQGFPDHYTDIKPKSKQTPDGPRYKALGNSMAVPVMRWIGERIQKVEDIIK
jgi:DNA (cytosine-5)-methyltransferase 1